MIDELSPFPPNFKFSDRAAICCSNRSSGVYPLNQGHLTWLVLSVNKQFYTLPSPLRPHTDTDTHTYTHARTHTHTHTHTRITSGLSTSLHETRIVKLLSSWDKELDENGMVATVLMDLSKRCGCIPHDLLLAQLTQCGDFF